MGARSSLSQAATDCENLYSMPATAAAGIRKAISSRPKAVASQVIPEGFEI
jgi:hypothetical protein